MKWNFLVSWQDGANVFHTVQYAGASAQTSAQVGGLLAQYINDATIKIKAIQVTPAPAVAPAAAAPAAN